MVDSEKRYLFFTNQKKYIKISITDNYNLIYTIFNDKNEIVKDDTIIKKNVIDFSGDLDENDNIHIIHMDNKGNFIYSVLRENNIKNNILKKFNLTLNKYKEFKIMASENNIDIFYLSNDLLNPNLWTINHLKANKEGWIKNNVISFSSLYKNNIYNIIQDKYFNIHLAYLKAHGSKHQVNYISYNHMLGKWINNPTNLSNDDDCHSLELYVDSKEKLNIIWLSERGINHRILSLINSYKKNWKKIFTQSNNLVGPPIITEDKGRIYIAVKSKENNELLVFKHEDNENKYFKTITLNKEKYFKHANNYNNYINIYTNYILCEVTDQIFILYPENCEVNNNIQQRTIKLQQKLEEIQAETKTKLETNKDDPYKHKEEDYNLSFHEIESNSITTDIEDYIDQLNEIIKNEIKDKQILTKSNEESLSKFIQLSEELEGIKDQLYKIKNKSFWEKVLDIFK